MRMMMRRYGNTWLVLVVLIVLACKGNKVGEGAKTSQEDVTGFYDTKTAAKTEVANAEVQPAGKKIVMYEMPAPLKDRPEQILKRKGYTTSYNNKTKNPNWVAWHLTKSHTYGSFQRKDEMFTVDEDAKGGRATDSDYYNSRYDRGHMCPAGDNKWDKQAMEESFLFTNICPQNHGLNKYEWNDLEIKVVLCRQGSPKAIGFIYRNEGVKQKMEDAVYTVDEIEQLTGMDFFPSLDDKTEDRIEAKTSLSEW